jgi:transposase InsO family protein
MPRATLMEIRRAFGCWGRPGGLRVDNGSPWGLKSGLPPDLALWLIGLGVGLSWIPPRPPQSNGKVERCHG